ncbi:PREDICTED: helicase with zinc finger domain 2 isoform X2 [Propithecus coquereli]|uniref:helicase with zinc finger domain 2 isoform X2 n=1 Tax=Propithecus coquereli TaxID=379532 RepID=UPI00063F3EAB|nr:PREDICTED: helicase with zinc finger domain 2 isoform X2 [Propithecus coquereli]
MEAPGSCPSPASPTATKGPSLARLRAQLDLYLGCSRCTQRLNESTYILRGLEHSCPREILLARFKRATKSKVWRKVGRRPSFPRPSRYEVCRYYSPGLGCRRHRNQCTFARSREEALVWTFEREHNLRRLWLKAAVQGEGAQGGSGGPGRVADAIREEFGGHFELLCSLCFRHSPQRIRPVDPQGPCPEHGACPSLLTHVSTEGHRKQQFVEVRPQPQYGQPLAYCMFVGRGRPCRHGASRCQYAHSAVEMAVWEAELLNSLKREDLLTPAALRDGCTAPRRQLPGARLYCHACQLTCHSQEAFENHCSSWEHTHMVALDLAVPWEHRRPPMGLSKFELCPEPDLCEYGDVCTKAHSAQELQEWVQRVQAAELREQAAWRDGLVPYQVRLLAEYEGGGGGEALVLAETVEGVSVSCNQPLVHRAREKKTQHSWVFTIRSEDPLLHVALLKQEPGADFSLLAPGLPPGRLYARGERFREPRSPTDFRVGVSVQTTSFGTFKQWVVFDFGRRPVLLQKLELELGQVHCPGLREGTVPGHSEELERWHPGNRHVVPGVEQTAEQTALMAKYKVPAQALESTHSSPAPGPPSRANYRQRMHRFLYEEEAAQQWLVAKLSLRAQVSLKTALQTPALGMLFASPGALYAEVPIPASLAPDTEQGFLLGRAVSTALVAPVPAPNSTVFEVRLERRARSEQALWLLLPAHCCEALGLQPEASPILEVQFQIDPLTFCLWHQAVDALPEERLVVPDLPACALPCPRPAPPSLRGNCKQKLAMALIAGSGPGDGRPVSPLLIYGPFGTGKTYTLAMASLQVLRQPRTRVLICTHTNRFHVWPARSPHSPDAPARQEEAPRTAAPCPGLVPGGAWSLQCLRGWWGEAVPGARSPSLASALDPAPGSGRRLCLLTWPRLGAVLRLSSRLWPPGQPQAVSFFPIHTGSSFASSGEPSLTTWFSAIALSSLALTFLIFHVCLSLPPALSCGGRTCVCLPGQGPWDPGGLGARWEPGPTPKAPASSHALPHSAADIYVQEYFHGYVSGGHPEATPLRVMYTDRPPRQTDPTTLRYCCLTQDGRAFRPPTEAELARHRLVVTTTSQARELRVPAGFFSHILIDEAAQMLECEALTPLRYATPGTRVVLAGDHMQVAPKLFSVARARAAEHTLLYRLFLHYQQEAHEVARQSRVVFHENYRSTEAIVRFVSRHFYLAKGSPIHASGKVPCHPRRHPLVFCHVAGSPERDMSRTSWLNLAEIVQVVEQVQDVYDTWPSCWGGREQRYICAVSHGAQVGALRQELRRRNLGEVSVGSFEILPGRQFRAVVLSTVHNRDSLLGPGAPAADFFTDARVLNTVLTRAQSQLVAVGDAVALCSFGACSKLWKSFIRECVERRSVCPQGLSLEQIEQGVARGQRCALRAEGAGAAAPSRGILEGPVGGPAVECTAAATVPARAEVGDQASCATARGITAVGSPAVEEAAPAQTAVRTAALAGGTAPGNAAAGAPAAEGGESEDPEDAESDFWPSDGELNADDSILQELLDESRKVTVTVGEDGLLDTVARPASPRQARHYVNLPSAVLLKLLVREPELYRRCTFLPETFERASAVPRDGEASGAIQLRGRRNCGMAFSGDEVLVKVLPGAAGDGGLAERLQGRVVGVLKRRRQDLAFVCRVDEWDPRIMVPLNGSVTKIFVAELKDPLQVPVYRLHQGRVQRVGQERLTPEARRGRLFWVRIVLWRTRFYYPLGVVLEVLPEATSWDRGLRILDLEYGLRAPSPDPAAVTKVLQKHRAELGRVGGRREDCRRLLTFTVDPQDACNLDDALSVRDLGPSYEVAVHIADVASLLPRDGALDVEARRRGTAFYAPGREPVPMLPASLCRDALSLLPGQDRPALSLFLTMEKDSGQLRGLRFALSVVCSDRQLSYEEAERVIREHAGAGRELPARLDSVDACVVAAFYFSRVLRQHRLQGACLYEQLDEDSTPGFRAAHLMVKEYMIQFNSLAAEFLVGSERTRTVTPLRRQPAPSSHQLKAVSEKHGPLVPLSLHLSHHLRGGGHPAPQLQLLASLWKQVQCAACSQDYEQMADLIATDDMHPSLAPAGLDFRKALGRSVFGRSGQDAQPQAGHYMLQVGHYTWATSPIRRYLDVVLQRQILLALGHGGAAYSVRDIDRLCLDFGRQHAQAQSYQRRARGLQLAVQLKAQPRHKLGFVVDVDGGGRGFKLLFPTHRETLPDPCPVLYRALQLAEPPRDPAGQPGLQLLWRRRVYSTQGSKPAFPTPGALHNPHTRTVSAAVWKRLLALVEEQRWPEAAALVREQGEEASPGRELVQVRRSRCGHFLEVAQELGSGDTLQVQLGASLQRGFLAPTLQLWAVAPGLSLCLEHVERPGDCFVGHAHRAPQDRYRDVDEYARVWQPFCALESVTSAVAENSSITLQHLRLSWDAEQTPQGQLQGTFRLEASFLRENCIDVDLGHCYLCIRLEGLRAPPGPPAPGPSSFGPLLSVDPGTYTWVAHGLTEDSDQEGRADGREAPGLVHFFIHHMAMEKVPEDVLRPGTQFTVEVLPKQLPDLRKEEAVRRLARASPLVTSIALGRPVQQPLPRATSRFLAQQTFDIPGGRHKLNASQNGAVREALRRPFAVIQGPPGTGKTVVGLHVIYWFHKSNQEQGQPDGAPGGERQPRGPCILYCGPSNKSVDVLAGMLLSRAELRPLRVYSEQAEASEFPVPGVGSRALPKKAPWEGRPNPALRSITLHHRIRQASNPDAPAIRAFDARLQKGEVFSREDLVAYRRVLGRARRFELDQHVVILCTCSCAAAASLRSLDVRQILVDEAGMATEPETLIPLVHFPQAEKVVLLGDHKQLRPVVRNERLQNLALDRSLFERYHRDAYMLDTQYRMHPGICAFPSAEFYQGKLKTWQGLRRPPSVLGHAGKESCPVIFGHVQGHEQSLLVSTDEGNENSKANLEEVAVVVSIAKQLTLGRMVEPRDVAVLTPYNAQASEIRKGLLREGVSGVTVSSITKSQGSEWRYVLVSTVRTCARSDLDQQPTKAWLKKFLGFVVDPNQVNVAVTRAQEGLCLIGDHLLLRCCPLWRHLLDFCEAQQSLVPAKQVRVRRRPALSS